MNFFEDEKCLAVINGCVGCAVKMTEASDHWRGLQNKYGVARKDGA
jgi:hypothetical protein